ncbi:hypothetical protein C8R47DRAFT_1064810 [Mycena vitilis]|nr:hypothetical protein C8R47DRAFT_1064810 [Mycena vitilis]
MPQALQLVHLPHPRRLRRSLPPSPLASTILTALCRCSPLPVARPVLIKFWPSRPQWEADQGLKTRQVSKSSNPGSRLPATGMCSRPQWDTGKSQGFKTLQDLNTRLKLTGHWDVFKTSTSRHLKPSRLAQDSPKPSNPGSRLPAILGVQDLGGIPTRPQDTSRRLKQPRIETTSTHHWDAQDVKPGLSVTVSQGLVPAHLALPTTCACVN